MLPEICFRDSYGQFQRRVGVPGVRRETLIEGRGSQSSGIEAQWSEDSYSVPTQRQLI